MLVRHIAQGIGPGEAAAHADIHDFLRVQAGTGTAAERFLADGMFGHFHKIVAHRAQNGARLFQQPHAAGRVARIVPRRDDVVVAFRSQIELFVMDEIRGEFRDMHHFGGRRVFEHRSGDRRYGLFQIRRGGTVVGGHILVHHTPHMSALAAENPF